MDGPKNLQYPEHGTEPVATYTAEDPEGTEITWGIEDTDEEHFRISEEGVLSFIKPPDYENPVDFRLNNTYEIRLLAFDSGIPRASGRLQVRIEIKQVNEIGPISGEVQLSAEEGETGTLAQYTAEDPEEDTIQWSLTGPDAEFFQIDEAGTLSLKEAVDFETPASAGGTNDYAVIVVATDDNRRPVSLELPVIVAVTNVNEGPVGTQIPSLELTTKDALASLDLTEFFTDPDGDSLTYTVTNDAESDVASATLEKATLTIEPVQEGATFFLITAMDDGEPPLSQQLQLAVTVTVANEQPVSVPIPDVELIAGSTATTLDLSEFFADPDGDSLTYGIDSGEESNIASATVVGNILSITPSKEGAAVFQVTATDEAGLATTIALEVSVATPPPPPVPTLTPTPAIAPEPTPTPTPKPTPKATPTPMPTATPMPSPTPTETLAPSPGPTLAPTASPTPTSTSTPAAEPTPVAASQARPTPQDIRTVAPETAQTPEEMPTSFLAWVVTLIVAGFLLALAGAAIYAYRLRR